MNRKPLPILLAIALLVVSLPLVAYAADARSMDVAFTLTEDDVTSPTSPDNSEPAPSAPAYVVNIPANLNLNASTEVIITWVNNNLVDGQRVVVSIDGAQTFPDGSFFLTTGDGSTLAQRVVCNIMRGSASAPWPYYQTISGPDDVVVAEFFGGSTDALPSTYGKLDFSPTYSFDNVAGAYTGTVHFKVTLLP